MFALADRRPDVYQEVVPQEGSELLQHEASCGRKFLPYIKKLRKL